MSRPAAITKPDAAPSSHAVEIGTGLYKGIVQDVAEGRHVIGSGETSDLVLMEPGLAPRHAVIELRGAVARVEALAEGVVIAGLGALPPGEARTVGLPASITIGGIAMTWRGTAPSASLDRPPRVGRRAILGVVTVLPLTLTGLPLFSGLIADAAVPLGGGSTDARQAPVPPSPVPDAVPTAQHPKNGARTKSILAPRPEDALAKAATALRRQVEEAGLARVRIAAGSGAVIATGSVEPAHAEVWKRLQHDFDERFLGDVALLNDVAVKSEKLPTSLAVEGVWRGREPYIVLRGQRYFVGAILEGGWAIRAIEQDRVMLEREGRLVAMRF